MAIGYTVRPITAAINNRRPPDGGSENFVGDIIGTLGGGGHWIGMQHPAEHLLVGAVGQCTMQRISKPTINTFFQLTHRPD